MGHNTGKLYVSNNVTHKNKTVLLHIKMFLEVQFKFTKIRIVFKV